MRARPVKAGPSRCRNCGGSSRSLRLRDVNRGGRRTFRYRRCESCALTWAADPETNLGQYYETDYFSIPAGIDELRAGASGEQFKVDLLETVALPGGLLEIGPAFGTFAVLARDRGFTVDVVEPDAECARFLRSLGGIGVVESADPLAYMGSGRSWDVIAMWQSLEHLNDAPDILAALGTSLTPGGVAIIATPDPDSPQARFFGRRWAHNDAPRHRWLFPRRTLLSLAERAGLKLVLLTDRDAGSLGWNSFGWAHSLGRLAPEGPARNIATLVGRLLARVIAPIERTGGRGASYTAVLARPK
jgi:SAM-dependent methyltransferase